MKGRAGRTAGKYHETMPVEKLIIQMLLPRMFSTLVQFLYNIVDSIFVSRVAEDALTAVTLAMPLQSTMTAITVGFSVGVNAVPSKCHGGISDPAGQSALFLKERDYICIKPLMEYTLPLFPPFCTVQSIAITALGNIPPQDQLHQPFSRRLISERARETLR